MSDIMATPPQPVNYSGLQIQADPVGAFQKAAQAQAGIQNTQAQTGLLNAQAQNTQQAALLQSLAAQRQQNFGQQWQKFSQNPTPQGAVQMAMSNPEWATQVSGAWNQYNEQQRQQKIDMMAPLAATLQNGRLDLAQDLVQQHIDAIQNTQTSDNDPQMQQDLNSAKHMLGIIQGDQQNGTKNALSFMYGTLAAAMGPQDFMTHYGQGQTMPSTIETASYAPKQAAANVAQTNATTQNIQSEIQNRAAQFGLDQNRFQGELQLRLRQLNYEQTAPYMDDGTRTQVAKGQMDAVQYGQMADRTGSLLSNVATLGQNGQWGPTGKPGDVVNWWKNFTGSQDNMSALRSEYQAVTQNMNGAAISGLSADQQKALKGGLPPANASDQNIVQFLGAMRNAELRQARIADGSSTWAATFGWMGPAKYDSNVGGIQVAKGTTFSQFLKNSLSAGSTAPSPYAAPTAAPGVQIGPQSFQTQPGQAGPLTGPLARYNRYLSGQ